MSGVSPSGVCLVMVSYWADSGLGRRLRGVGAMSAGRSGRVY